VVLFENIKNQMNTNKKLKNTKSEEISKLEIPINEYIEKDSEIWNPGEKNCYVVVRNDVRVSDKDYDNLNDPKALLEKSFWQKIIKKWPDGTKIEIVKYDKKKHRIW